MPTTRLFLYLGRAIYLAIWWAIWSIVGIALYIISLFSILYALWLLACPSKPLRDRLKHYSPYWFTSR